MKEAFVFPCRLDIPEFYDQTVLNEQEAITKKICQTIVSQQITTLLKH